MIEEKILDNLIALQKVHTGLAEKFDSLSKQISQLLNLFEMTAKSFASNPANMVTEKDKDFLEKIDRLLEQNKTIAKGLTLMEERIRERVTTVPRPQQMPPSMFPPTTMPIPPSQQFQSSEERKEDEYELSSLGKPLPKF
jgi:hypothetical protein